MQSPGAYALVNAMKNNLESKLIEVELTVRLRDMKNKFFLVDKQFYSNPYHIKVKIKGVFMTTTIYSPLKGI